MTKPRRSWSILVRVDDVPETGLHMELSVDEKTREAVAKEVGVRTLARLAAEFDLTRYGSGGLRVVGDVRATVGQTCVVTLEPLENELSELVDLVFSPVSGNASPKSKEEATILDVTEPPEALVDGVVDLGAVATEFLLLGIDPYPRKPGAVFEAPLGGDSGAHPFAVLAALKKGPRES